MHNVEGAVGERQRAAVGANPRESLPAQIAFRQIGHGHLRAHRAPLPVVLGAAQIQHRRRRVQLEDLREATQSAGPEETPERAVQRCEFSWHRTYAPRPACAA